MEQQTTELEELEGIYCEMYKDVYGIKARWYRADSIAQVREDLASLQKQAEEVWERERQAQLHAIAAFEELAKNYGGVETAKRWQHQAYNTRGDDEYLCYHLGLPYGYFKGK